MAGPVMGGICRSCARRYFPSPAMCPKCLSRDIEPSALAARGTVRTGTTVRVASPEFAAPYAVAWVDTDDGVRLFGRLDGAPDVGARVAITADDQGLPGFEVLA